MSKQIGVLVFSLLLGCGATTQQLQKRASFDLECPIKDLEIIEIDYDTRGVRGCGRQATYVEHRQDDGWTWLMNSDILGKAAADKAVAADGTAPHP